LSGFHFGSSWLDQGKRELYYQESLITVNYFKNKFSDIYLSVQVTRLVIRGVSGLIPTGTEHFSVMIDANYCSKSVLAVRHSWLVCQEAVSCWLNGLFRNCQS